MKLKLIPLAILILSTTLLTPPVWGQSAPETTLEALDARIQRLESADEAPGGDHWTRRITLSGVIEVEASYANIDIDDPAAGNETTSDVDLAAVEFGVDAAIVDHVDGHVLFKYEDDDVFVDEGYILLDGGETLPAYLIAGRQYLPFGSFDTHFVSDPLTLTLGETNEGALVAGWRFGGEWADLSVGAFNGDAKQAGSDNTVRDMVAGVVVRPADGFRLGVSYTSNLAAAGGLFDVLTADELSDTVGGWSIFLSAALLDRFTVIVEYVAAVDDFEAGELYIDTDTENRRPEAWNIEIGCVVVDAVEVALRYGGSTDGGAGEADFLPQDQYGAVVNWGVFDNTLLAVEYLHADFEDDLRTSDTLTAQLAVEF